MPDIDLALITTREAAELLDESVRQTIRRVERGQLTPAKKLEGIRGSYIFKRADILALSETSPATRPVDDPQLSAGRVPNVSPPGG